MKGVLSFLFLLCLFSLPVLAGVQNHSAIEIYGGTFGPGNYVFPNSVYIVSNLRVGTVAAEGQKLMVVGSANITGQTFLGGSKCASGQFLTTNPITGLVSCAAGSGGSLPSGSAGQTLRHDGSNWVATSNIFHSGGNIGINKTSPTERLDVAGNIQNILSPSTSLVRKGAVTLNTGENSASAIAISGRYAYVATFTTPARIVILDISNPSDPQRIGSVTLDPGENSVYSISISGRYAYVATYTTPAKVVVVDVSNPASPQKVAAVTLNSGENSAGGIAISGRYAYVTTSTSPSRLVVVDVSNPASPRRVGNVTLGPGENSAGGIAISGRYAFISTYTAPAKVIAVDVSNPALPQKVGVVTLNSGEDNAWGIAVLGRYVYVATDTSPARVIVVNVSNPASPQRVGAVTLDNLAAENKANSIAVSGRYVYVPTYTVPARLVVVDVSNPISPQRVASIQLGSNEDYGWGIAVSGRYAYVATYNSPARVVIVDILGIESTAVMAHSLEAGSLQVRDDITVEQDVRVGGGLNVGAGGVYSAGSMAAPSLEATSFMRLQPSSQPAGANGVMYYDSTLNKFRCYQNGAWTDCIFDPPSAYVISTVNGPWAATAAKAGAAYILISPIFIPAYITVNQMRIYVTTALGAAGDVGVYNAWGTLVLNGGSSSLSTTTGLKTITPQQTSRTLPPGQYYVAVTWNSATGVIAGINLNYAGVIPGTGFITSGGGSVLPSSISISSITDGQYLYGVTLNT